MFSVIIPLYNKSDFILRAIKSVRTQSFSDWEVIVVDDGSTDDSYEKIIPYLSEKIKVIQQENKGVSEARNLGISMAKFAYIAFLDADDYWSQGYLAFMAEGINKFPNAGIWGTKTASNGEEIGMVKYDFQIIENYFFYAFDNIYHITSSTVVDKVFFKKNEGFKKEITRGEDLDVWYRAICFFGNPVFSKSKMVYYETMDNNSLAKLKFPISKSILSVIGNSDYCLELNHDTASIKEFEKFRTKFVYFGVVDYFRSRENINDIKKILVKLNNKLFFMDFFYSLPVELLFWFFSNSKRKRWFLKISNFFYNR